MIQRIRFAGKLVNAARKPLADLQLVLQVFDLSNEWRTIGESSTDSGGVFKGEADVGGLEQLEVAPQFRLMTVDDEAVVRDLPQMRLSRGTLALDYDTVVLSKSDGDNSFDRAASDELARLKTQLLTAEIELDETKSRLAARTESLNAAVLERDDLQLQLEQIRDAGASSPLIADLAGQVATSFSNATPLSDAGGFQLGEARVTLKGYLVDGGNRFKPLDVAEAASVKAEGASEISFNLRSPTSETTATQTMPDLVGLTASTARRTIRPFGLEVQVVERPGTPVGAVLTQHPAAGAELEAGATVVLQVAVSPSEE